MGTRSVLVIKNEEGKDLVKVYRQFDGYPTGRGQDIQDFCKDGKFVNGLTDTTEKTFNGIQCFAASFVKHEKEGPGGIYLTTENQFSEEYGYVLSPVMEGEGWDRKVTGLNLQVYAGRKRLYDGPLNGADMEAIEKGDGE